MSDAMTLAPTVNWEAELRGAATLMKSGLLPKAITSPEAALFLILTGRDLGLSPVQSVRSIHIIQGKVELDADIQLAIFKNRGGRAQFRELTDKRAVLELIHPNGDTHVETFTWEDATRAKLVNETWQKWPKAMLRSRAITAGMKSVGFDLLSGTYAEGEIGGPMPSVPSGASAAEVSPAASFEAMPAALLAPEVPLPVGPGAFPIPFGKHKGEPLSTLTDGELADGIQWVRTKAKNPAAMQDFVDAAELLLEDRARQLEATMTLEAADHPAE